MYMRIVIGRVRPGCWEQYEAAYRNHVEPQLLAMPGLKACWLGRSATDPDMGCTVSQWSTRATMESYERSDAVRGDILPAVAPYLSSNLLAHHCAVDERT